MEFKELGLNSQINEGIEAMGFSKATPIQEKSIPVIMKNSDIIACAQTGTGKTAAFLLPILHNLVENENKDEKIKTLIVVPTRELVLQIDQQLQGFSYFLDVSSMPIYGGGDSIAWDVQKQSIIDGTDIIITTPGRFIAHMNLGYVDLSGIHHFILDEADRMLDMGFHDDIMQIVNELPSERQTLMFSATMPPKIRTLAKKVLSNPEEINISISKPAENILQAAYVVYDNQKIDLIIDLLAEKEIGSVIIFAATKTIVRQVASTLKSHNLNIEEIHSGLEQKDREEALLRFKNKKTQILVATNLISRGIDVDGIELVINYDVPNDAADYVHRVGRTARAAKSGVALTFINDKDQHYFAKIEELIEKEVFKIDTYGKYGDTPEYNPIKKKKYTQKKNFKRYNKSNSRKPRS